MNKSMLPLLFQKPFGDLVEETPKQERRMNKAETLRRKKAKAKRKRTQLSRRKNRK